MKKVIVALTGIFFFLSTNSQAQIESLNQNKKMEEKTIYQFKVLDIRGKEFDFETLRGKKILIVNTASKCGYTPQYAQLQSLYEKFKDKNFVVIGFPSNDFGEQEPGNNKEIATFCQANYGVTFPVMDKISVTGEKMNPLYQFLTDKTKNGVQSSEVEWNFQKYLINEKGYLEKVLMSKVKPLDNEIIEFISR